jgi:hypothetical protein
MRAGALYRCFQKEQMQVLQREGSAEVDSKS